MPSIIILDYGVGNIGNIKHAFEKMGYDAQLTNNPEAIRNADLLVLPGVGAFGDAMEKLESDKLDLLVLERAISNKLVLGICLGMQVLCEGSEENGEQPGLGWFKGTLKKFDEALRVPHMGWNTLTFTQNAGTIQGSSSETQPYVYFVHSYKLTDFDPEQLVAYSDYGGCVPAIVKSGAVTGFQFHPEKSGPYGLQLLKNYMLENGF